MFKSVEHRRLTAQGEDPQVAELRDSVARLRRELAGHPAELPDRGVAEDELRALHAMARSGAPEIMRLRRSLLLVAASIGSVSALSGAMTQVRNAVDLFGPDR
ncbi:DUF5955 family protein [Streptomyces hypolithicus]